MMVPNEIFFTTQERAILVNKIAWKGSFRTHHQFPGGLRW